MVNDILRKHFGFEALRDGQTQVIDDILKGRSAAAIFPTGSGKSLCYQLPALLLPHLTLVVSPLLALIKDQLEFLHSKGISAASIDSSQDKETLVEIMQQVRNGQIKVLMISVERFKNERFRQFISQVPISMLVVDEAHCISEWGHNFRPDYLKLPYYRELFGIPQVLLLTATATPKVINDMCRKFHIGQDQVTVTGFYRSNLQLQVVSCSQTEKFFNLQQILQSCSKVPVIVYVTLQKTAEILVARLEKVGIAAAAYHAGLSMDQRNSVQRQFMDGSVGCIVATIAFGMGVDKADIRKIIHYDLPKSIENYSQEIGRAGRDGKPAVCITLANTENLHVLENFIYGDTPDRESIEYVVGEIYACQGDWEVLINNLSRSSNIRQLPLRTLLVYLELNEIIESQYSYFGDYRFKLIDSENEIIQRFDGERRRFVETIFQCSTKARTWYSIDFDAIWNTYNGDRRRVIAAVDYFYEKGWLELESKQITEVYKIINRDIPKATLIDRLDQLFVERERSEIGRIKNMLTFFESQQCLSHSLADYFADKNAPKACGHCSVCDDRVIQLQARPQPTIVAAEMKTLITPFIQSSPDSLTAKAVTRFLCGITTPLSSKLKASRMDGFGKYAEYPFAEVHGKVAELMAI